MHILLFTNKFATKMSNEVVSKTNKKTRENKTGDPTRVMQKITRVGSGPKSIYCAHHITIFIIV